MDFLRKLAFHFFSSLNCSNNVYVRKFSKLVVQSERFSVKTMIELLAKFMENQIRFSWKSLNTGHIKLCLLSFIAEQTKVSGEIRYTQCEYCFAEPGFSIILQF